MPTWAALLLTLTACAGAAYAFGCFRTVRALAQRGTLKGIRAHLDSQDEAIRSVRREWAQASEELTRICEDIAKERAKSQAASARAAKAEKRAQGDNAADPAADFEAFKKRRLAAIQLGEG